MKAVLCWVEAAGGKSLHLKSLTSQMGLKDPHLTMLTVTSLFTKSISRDATFANSVKRHLKQWVTHLFLCMCFYLENVIFYLTVTWDKYHCIFLSVSNSFHKWWLAGYLLHLLLWVLTLKYTLSSPNRPTSWELTWKLTVTRRTSHVTCVGPLFVPKAPSFAITDVTPVQRRNLGTVFVLN